MLTMVETYEDTSARCRAGIERFTATQDGPLGKVLTETLHALKNERDHSGLRAMSCRVRMNEALRALRVTVQGLNEVQDRAK